MPLKFTWNTLRISFYALIFLLPLSFNFGGVVYLTDVVLALFLLNFFIDWRGIYWQKPASLIWFLGFAGIAIFFAVSPAIAAVGFVRLGLLAVFALAVAKLVRAGFFKEREVFGLVVGSAVSQAVLGAVQFFKQGSLGLARIGEAVLGADIPGVAKIIVDGEKIVRAYGLFPHPNVLAAFLLLGILAVYYLWFREKPSVTLAVGFLTILFGLALTFSRTAWMIAILLTAAAVGYALVVKTYRRSALLLLPALVVGGLALAILLGPQIAARSQVAADEPAFVLRGAYNKVGWEIIKSRPLGVGIGNQVQFAIENGLYQKFGLTESWQFQPIHNIYLLIASEVGILGLAAFLIFLIKKVLPNLHPLALVIPLSLLAFGLLDHFLWTYQPGRLMLWLIIGILMGLSARSSTDRTYPSEG